MPEGHKTHRIAIDQTEWIGGQTLRITSPQGRFRGDARKVTGRTLDRVEAIGKHLFYHFRPRPSDSDATGDRLVHVHLGRYGAYRIEPLPPPKPVGQIRMRIVASAMTIDLRGPTRCRVVGAVERQSIADRLGPDPLAGGRKRDVYSAIEASPKPIAALLLDQSVVAGVGNIFRAEMLFEAGIDPRVSGQQLGRERFDRLWKILVKQMRTGLKYGKIVTVTRREAGRPLEEVNGRDRFRIYGQTHCPRCNAVIERADIASRTMYWCPRCQRQDNA